jgi:uncharacterized cofD-like protein
MKKVTVIGGGTGTFVVLSGLKQTELDLGVIVTMMDSGGSTGRLRDQLGVLPPGDLRQCLVALSDAPLLWRKLFLYRFENGDLKGHNFGNIFLSALEKVSSSYDEVLETAEYVLKTRGEVIPVTFEKTHLCVEYASGTLVCGEGNIDEDNPEETRITRAFVDPPVKVNPHAVQRIMESDFIIVGPGDLYTSIIPVLLIDGVKEAIKKRNPTVIYNMNLMTKMGQTTHYTAADHIEDLTKYLGKEPEYVIMNNGSISKQIMDWYNAHNEVLVKNDLNSDNYSGTIIEEAVVDKKNIEKSSSDTLTRSLVRHDSQILATLLHRIITQ